MPEQKPKPCFGCGELYYFEEGEEQLCPSCIEARGEEMTTATMHTPLWSKLTVGFIGLCLFSPFILMILSVVL